MQSQLAILMKTATSTGALAVLSERDLSPILTEAAMLKEPLLALMNFRQVRGTPVRFKRRDVFPEAVFEGSTSAGNFTRSDWASVSVDLKPVRSWGETEAFDIATIENWNAFSVDVLGHVYATAYLLAGCALYGDEVVDFTTTGASNTNANLTYQFDGLLNSAMTVGANLIEGAGARGTQATVADFDNLIDNTNVGGTQGNVKVLIMSSQMMTRLARQATAGGADTGLRFNVELGQNVPAAGIVAPVKYHSNYFPMGVDLFSYRGKLVYPSDFTRPIAQMGAVTVAAAAGGSLAAGSYRYAVAPVTWRGEQLAAFSSSVGVSGANGTVNITITPFKFPGSRAVYTDALYYRVYRSTVNNNGTSPGVYQLIGTYPAATYNANGQQTAGVTTLSDTGAVTDANRTAQYPLTQNGSVNNGTLASPNAAGNDEVVWLVNLNVQQGCELVGASDAEASAAPEAGLDILRFKRLAETKDTVPFFVRSFAGLLVKRIAGHGMIRGLEA
jgi:hypothetical protein